ncbi:MarR family transcriptional regulator [Spirillospora sp. NPDC047279]|uniref:GbsR/MarR family transcriptional regulator n=1 Tax=Spirillospora sp. NPDC047279 TaxID=3155478 RepID=UPI00340841AF
MTDPSPNVRDDVAVLQYVERFAAMLADSGWPRMAARVFVVLMVTDSGSLTAAEIGRTLQVSPAAVSGAVRWLTTYRLASREREPGSRRDIFRVRNDAWQDALASRDALLAHYTSGLAEGSKLVGEDTVAGRRLAEASEFFEFVRAELAGLMDRWREYKATDGQGGAGAGAG